MVHNCVELGKLRVDIEQEAVLHISMVCDLNSLMCLHGVPLSPTLTYIALISALRSCYSASFYQSLPRANECT